MTGPQRELWLMRPGKAVSAPSHADHRRPLKAVARRSAQRVGAWMELLDLAPDLVISSPATRAQATATKACKVMGVGTDHIIEEPGLYDGKLKDLLSMIKQLPADHHKVLLVGHKGALQQLFSWLSDQQIKLKRGMLVRLCLEQEWSALKRSCCHNVQVMDPLALPGRFPFIHNGKCEYRKRPAYYYNQSAIIPYRMHQGRVEIMIVSSSNNRHWLIPKGIVEPGMTAEESACKEAYEEAGVKGVVEDFVGSYSQKKWGASCTVAVYAMRVTETLADHLLLEPNRKRRWLPIEQAVEQLQSRGLKKLLKLCYLYQAGDRQSRLA